MNHFDYDEFTKRNEKYYHDFQNLNPECEYNDVCECCWIKCSAGDKKDCERWHTWKSIDLQILFDKQTDLSGNFLFNF